jgi:hypothetical protein
MADEYADDDADEFERVLTSLRAHGLLLLTDSRLPSVAALVAGAPVRGSWWGHPRGGAIYAVAERLEALTEEVVCVKLVVGKETYLHRQLWPALVGAGAARAAWQTDGLSPLAARLLALIDRDGTARTDDLDELGPHPRKALGDAARELERALLVVGTSLHTETGAHAKQLETWARWAERVGFALAERLAPEDGQRALEAAVAALGEGATTRGRLPWLTR